MAASLYQYEPSCPYTLPGFAKRWHRDRRRVIRMAGRVYRHLAAGGSVIELWLGCQNQDCTIWTTKYVKGVSTFLPQFQNDPAYVARHVLSRWRAGWTELYFARQASVKVHEAVSQVHADRCRFTVPHPRDIVRERQIAQEIHHGSTTRV